MTAIVSIVMAFCTFSSIPMPRVNADEHNSRFMMAAFPLVGIVIGAIIVGWWALCDAVGFGPILRAAGLTLLPLVIAGGIHLDGFADVVDAVSSWAEPARRREILKDSHIGAFAAMGVAAYLLCYFAFAEQLSEDAGLTAAILVGLGFILSRGTSGLCGMLLPKSSDKGMLASQTKTDSRTGTIVILVILSAAALIAAALIYWPAAIAMLVASCLAVVILYRIAMIKFGGMSGDLCGFYTEMAELLMLIALVIVFKVVAL